MRPPPAPLLALVVLLPALAGCIFNPFERPPPGLDPRIVQEAWLVPVPQLSMDSPYGHVRVQGRALAVPVRLEGAEAGAVYLGTGVSWRTDAIFQARGRENVSGDLYVQVPLGSWPGLRGRQDWAPAGEADVQAFGYNGTRAALERANLLLPAKPTPPAPGFWQFNGTVSGRVDAANFTLASDEGPYVFQRNATGFIVIEGNTLLNFGVENLTLTASNDGLAQVKIHDRGLADFRELVWGPSMLRAVIATPPFRATDLEVNEDRTAQVVNVKLPRVAELSMVRFREDTVRDDFVEVKGANITLRMGP